MKAILDIQSAPAAHWVGNGFAVRSLFSYDSQSLPLSPFLLLDYAAPMQFPGDGLRRGVGEHPHRGFETVTIVYAGELEHRDSAGGGGVIGPGDVQWMTAGAGIVHEEFHSAAFTREGGELEMVQLWVNLPARDKMTPPRYQAILSQQIPVIPLADDSGQLRVIAGEYGGHQGAAQTFSPLDVWDLRLKPGPQIDLPAPEGHNLIVVSLQGQVEINGTRMIDASQRAVLETTGAGFSLQAHSDARLLVLGGQPLNEPVVGYGPFVMNSQTEIRQAIDDFNEGRFAGAIQEPV